MVGRDGQVRTADKLPHEKRLSFYRKKAFRTGNVNFSLLLCPALKFSATGY